MRKQTVKMMKSSCDTFFSKFTAHIGSPRSDDMEESCYAWPSDMSPVGTDVPIRNENKYLKLKLK